MSGLEKLYFDRESYDRDCEIYSATPRNTNSCVMPQPAPDPVTYYGTKSELMARREQQRQHEEWSARQREKFAAHEKISKELFVAGGGIHSVGMSPANGWVPEVTLYRDYPQRETLEARILAIEPRAIIDYAEGTHRF
ncbi:hypothetical protein [Medusavirus stheno T3]|uniref:Uncharacterized protein n=1 Tax=Medusavirus stheno T3 TaxID=3069717 RepID=A0A7S7YF15_9VIRU|nr:hypothetical protein QKU73_gp169 [Acanthamoeba castellanii medusavirus]QPB44606.1 hypothetical protein [Medusavirus stheno T3]